MKLRTLLATATAAALCGAGALVPMTATAAVPETVVAVIDTGINAQHEAFDYRGATSADDQLVAWWDFSDDAKAHLPKPGQIWDDLKPEPYDNNGHGSSSAAMVAGRNVSAEQTPSFCPGCKLAIAKVGSGESGDDITGSLAEAITWASDTVGADIINLSIGAIIPLPASAVGDVYDAFSNARRNGALVVVSNGNGIYNAGIPDPGWAVPYGNSPDVLAVGASGLDGLLVTTDPEVVSDFYVHGPSKTGSSRTGYREIGGTSFAAPRVAGFAARLRNEAAAAGRTMSPQRLEDLIKASARDTELLPIWEGYGIVDADQLPAAVAHARAGTLPGRDPVNAFYVESVNSLLDTLFLVL